MSSLERVHFVPSQ